MSEEFKATVDGKEVPVEIIEGNESYEIREGVKTRQSYQRSFQQFRTISKWQVIAFMVIAVAVLLGLAFVSITLLIWALPILLPLAIVLFVVRKLKRG